MHAAGFVHRDLKPENIFLVDRDGRPRFVKLLDFGLVKALRGDVGAATATSEGTFMGSPAYTSPEQSAGKAVDQRSDIYAVGVMLHELVTGQLPFVCEHDRGPADEADQRHAARASPTSCWRRTSGGRWTRSSRPAW